MRDAVSLRLDRLHLHNFRCFIDCTIELHPNLTVLVAENGQGKTAILDAIGISLQPFADTVAGTRQFHGFDHSDVRLVRRADGAMQPNLPTEFDVDGYISGDALHWSRAMNGYGSRARTS